MARRSPQIPREGGIAHEVVLIQIRETETINIIVERLDRFGSGRFSLSVAPNPSPDQITLATAIQTYASARREKRPELFRAAVDQFAAVSQQYGAGPLINAAWAARIRVDDPKLAESLSRKALAIAPAATLENLMARMELGHALFSLDNVSREAEDIFAQIAGENHSGYAAIAASAAQNDLCLIKYNRSEISQAITAIQRLLRPLMRLGN